MSDENHPPTPWFNAGDMALYEVDLYSALSHPSELVRIVKRWPPGNRLDCYTYDVERTSKTGPYPWWASFTKVKEQRLYAVTPDVLANLLARA